MKKIVLISFLFANLLFFANAQVPDVKLGAKGGINFSNSTNSDLDSKTGFYIGVGEMFFSEQFSLRPEACYSTQGAERKNNNSNAKVNLEYIGIPVMTKYHLVDGLNIHVGTQFSFLSKVEAKGEIDGSGTVDIKDSTESFDFGVNFGVGYEFAAGVFVDVRYNRGLSKVNKESLPSFFRI